MVKYTIERLLLAIVTTFIIMTVTFLLIKSLPFKMPNTSTVAEEFGYFEKQASLGYIVDLGQLNDSLGRLLWSYVDNAGVSHYFYQRPILDQYCSWLNAIFTRWDWGTSSSIKPNEDVILIIAGWLPYTIKVNIWAVLISVPSGIALGIWAALKKNKLTDHIISTLVMIFISIPSFITITFLMAILCYQAKWLPSQWPSDSAPLGTQVLGYFIPVMSLSFGSICYYCRFTRAELTEVMSSDYLLLARTKGLTRNQAISRHAMKNAMVPILPSILSEFIGIFGGSFILEQIYGIPGIGKLYIQSLTGEDYNVLFVDMALFTVIGLIAGVFLDLSYGLIDPRIRMGAKK
jgi:oligopeptide transport system permease protein